MALRTVYCVQPYVRDGRSLRVGRMRQFATEASAVELGQALSLHTAGVVVFSVEGEPDFDYWSEPRLLATYGEVPEVGG